MSCVLELEGVTRIYPAEPPVNALVDVDLRIDAGEMIAVAGPSGSGKSTMLNIMGTLDRPTSGVVRIEGTDRPSCRIGASRDFVRPESVSSFRGSISSRRSRPSTTWPTGLLYSGTLRQRSSRRSAHAEALVNGWGSP